MKRILIAAAGLSLLASGAWAHGNDAKKADETKATAPTLSTSGELSGQVKMIDPKAHALTIALPTGDEQKLDVTDAKITRDGSVIGLDGLKEGDSVRASFDPKTNKALSLEVNAKAKAK